MHVYLTVITVMWYMYRYMNVLIENDEHVDGKRHYWL